MKKILLVEDERQLVKLVGRHLEKEGYEVLVAMDGEKALETVKQITPDLVILDIVLPGSIGGYEVCSRLRMKESTASVPIVMFTSRGGDMDKAMGFQCGANDYVVKPYDPKVLLDKVQELLA